MEDEGIKVREDLMRKYKKNLFIDVNMTKKLAILIIGLVEQRATTKQPGLGLNHKIGEAN